ncbi:hypothetical protein TNCV_3002651 [Trichonephila clavipes]|nr:hypothetical protein TNCV_3002651 [Trichonephila clavipes]
MVSRLWNYFQTSGAVTRNASQDRHRTSASAQGHHLALSARRHWWTMDPQPAHHNSIEYVWDGLGKALYQRSSSPRTLEELKVPLLEKWVLLPQVLIDTIINRTISRSEACIAVHSFHAIL